MLSLLLVGVDKPVQAQDSSGPAKGSATAQAGKLKAHEQAFVDQMHQSVLVGYFSMANEKLEAGGKPERYEIRSISKVKENLWLFNARVKYGNVDTVMPMMLPVEWAGETPVISMTDLTIPGMGTFSCRVLFHKDRYAGTWQHGEKGGHMWGLIEKLPAEK